MKIKTKKESVLEENKKMIKKNKNKIKSENKIAKRCLAFSMMFMKKTATFAFIFVIIFGQLFSPQFVKAATYNFLQNSWVGGVTTNTATHTNNQTGWTEYSSASSASAGADLRLPSTSFAFTDDGTASVSPTSSATGGGFGNGTNSNTAVSGVGAAASVSLAPSVAPVNKWDTVLDPLPIAMGNYNSMIRNGTDDDIYVKPEGTGFLKYSISSNSWTSLTASPGATGNGTNMIRNGADNDIYVTAGNGTGFYKYSISGNSWTTLTSLPLFLTDGSKIIRNGADN